MQNILKKLLVLSLTVTLSNALLPTKAETDPPVSGTTASITLNANGGAFKDGSAERIVPLNDEHKINNAKDIEIPFPKDETMEFSAWTRNDGTAIQDMAEETFVNNEVLYASYSPKAIEATSITLDRDNATVDVGEEFTLVATVLPEEASDKSVTWQSEDPKIASVDQNGKVSALAEGTTTITAVSANGLSASCEVTVNKVVIPVESIAIATEEQILKEGETLVLETTITPENATETVLAWTSSDPKVATVDPNGNVTGVKIGTTTITVTTTNGLTATYTVSVVANDPAACRVFGFCKYEDKDYWFEGGIRQAAPGDKKNIWDEIYHEERGREIYDPESDGWYWLDAVYDGAKAVNKEVWIPYIFQDEKPGSTEGKWVRYNKNGKMIKGWYKVSSTLDKTLYPEQAGNIYYYDQKTGEMYKGWHVINGKLYHFDESSGFLAQ